MLIFTKCYCTEISYSIFYVKKATYEQRCEFDSLNLFQSNQSLETVKYETQKFRKLIFTKIPLQKNFIRWFFLPEMWRTSRKSGEFDLLDRFQSNTKITKMPLHINFVRSFFLSKRTGRYGEALRLTRLANSNQIGLSKLSNPKHENYVG